MGKIFYQAIKPRVPNSADNIQVNFCKNPTCSNYGVPASIKKQPRGPGASLRGRDKYKVTDYGDYDGDHLAWLYNKASLHAINRFFMQVRRRLSLLERPIISASNTGRIWHGYTAYNPESIIKVLGIFRVFYNFTQIGKDNKTPAMRLGLAKGKVRLEDIIYEE